MGGKGRGGSKDEKMEGKEQEKRWKDEVKQRRQTHYLLTIA